MSAIPRCRGVHLDESSELVIGLEDLRSRSAATRMSGWMLVLAAALFLTALLGAAQVAVQQAGSVDDEAQASLEYTVE